MKGLDISFYQKFINFNAIQKAGIDFLILRAGYTGWGTGLSYYKDECFERFYQECVNRNIPRGCYWYSCANSSEKGISEAKFLYENCLKGKNFQFPIYIDVENEKHHLINKKSQTTDAIIAFCDYLEYLGYYVGIYASDISGFKDKMDISRLEKYDKWVACYSSIPKYITSYGMWQKTSSYEIPGYLGKLDYNESFKDYPSIIDCMNKSGNLIKKTDEELVKEVIDGIWGNGQERIDKLTNAGYNYENIQKLVNEKMNINIMHIVKYGETLSQIAQKYGTTYQKLAKYNNIKNPNLIYPNQQIKIPKR